MYRIRRGLEYEIYVIMEASVDVQITEHSNLHSVNSIAGSQEGALLNIFVSFDMSV